MSSSDVVLGAGMRSNLLTLQRTQQSISKVQNILSTGLKVGSALDNPQSYFAARSLAASSTNLLNLLDGVGQSIQTVKAADAAVQAITGLLSQADSIVSSAREAVSSGAVQASITGNVDLNGKSNLTTVTGVSNTDTIIFKYTNTSGVLTTDNTTVTVTSGDSIDQLLAKIKDVGGGGYFDASLTTEGYIKITETRGNAFNLNFTADGGAIAASASDSALATALGFGGQINATTRATGGVGNANAEITVAAKTRLESGVFYESGVGNGFAEASDLLSTIVRTDGATAGAATSRFINGSAGDALNLTFRVNGTSTSANIDIQSLSVQGLVDAINNDATVGSLIHASYDATKGIFSIEASSASVKTLNITATDTVAGGASTTTVDFDFGTKTAFLPGAAANDAEGETFTLASAAGTLDQLQTDYNTVLSQIDSLVADAGYRGSNLLKSSTSLDTYFNESRTNKLRTEGVDLSSSGLGLSSADFSSLTKIDAVGTLVSSAKTKVDNFGTSIANALTIIQTRETFTNSLIETLNEGSDKLTVADQNEEGAKLLALQTRQDLGVTALSLASQAQQSVLRLF